MIQGRRVKAVVAIALMSSIAMISSLTACIQTSGTANNDSAYVQPATNKIETSHNSFRITDVSVTSNGKTSKVASGTITNNDAKSHSFVYLKVSFLDSDMKVVSVEGTYAVGKEGLAPRESTTWQVHTSYDSSIKSARAEVVESD